MKRICSILILLIFFADMAVAEELEELKSETIYKLRHVVTGFINVPEGQVLKAGKRSKIQIYKKDSTHYYVEMKLVYRPLDEEGKKEYVKPGGNYKIKKDDLQLSDVTTSFDLTSGTLVVPFKLRANDGSLTGDATIGMYAGIRKDLFSIFDTIFLASFGLSNITVSAGENDNETRLGVTVALGFIITDWDKVQIGFITGIDHLGGETGKNWEYEDDPWFSVMIGYTFD